MPKRFDRKFGATLYRELSIGPGIYVFRDADGEALYVGKAKNLRRRLQGYRNATRRKAHRKMRALVREAETLEISEKGSEGAALLAENELIRTLRPPFNVDGAFFFLYPAVGIGRDGSHTNLVFTTDCNAFSHVPLSWFGTFRSRRRTKEAFDALVALLAFAGHIEPRSRTPHLPRHRGARAVVIRRLDAGLVTAMHAYWDGRSPSFLEELSLRILDNAAARRDAESVQQNLRTLDTFFRDDITRLHRALARSGRSERFVPQAERDALFIRSKA